MQSATLAAAVGVYVVVAYEDVRTRRIPNALSLATAVLGLIRIALAQDAVGAGCTLIAAAVVFGVAFALFRYGIIGGGDAKIIAATTLLVGYRDLTGFLFLMSLCGGALALAGIAAVRLDPPLRRLRSAIRRFSTVEADRGHAEPDRFTVPYGVAVATAGAITLITAR